MITLEKKVWDSTGNQSISVTLKWPITNSVLSFLFSFVLLSVFNLILSLFSLRIYLMIIQIAVYFSLSLSLLHSFPIFNLGVHSSIFFVLSTFWNSVFLPFSLALYSSHFLLCSFGLSPFPLSLYPLLIITSLIMHRRYLFIPLIGKSTYILRWELIHFPHKKWDQWECHMEH